MRTERSSSQPASPFLKNDPEMKRRPPIDPSTLFSVKLKKTKTTPAAASDSSRETTRKQLKFNKCSNEITQIYPYLYVSGDRIARNKEKLMENNVKYILNLAPSVCKNYHEEDDASDFVYHAINLIDSTTETDLLWVFLKGIEFIDKADESNSCFVHCHQGVSRSGAMVTAFVMWKEGLPFREAFESVKNKHAVCSPNAGFISQLIRFEKRLNIKVEADFLSELFLISKHNAKDQELILRPLENVNLQGKMLDVRGTFLLYMAVEELKQCVQNYEDFEELLNSAGHVGGEVSGLFFIWQGKDCGDKARHLLSTLEYVKLLKKYLPRYKMAHSVTLKKPSSEGDSADDKLIAGRLCHRMFFECLQMKEDAEETIGINDAYDMLLGQGTNTNDVTKEHGKSVAKEGSVETVDMVSGEPSSRGENEIRLFHCKVEEGLHSFEEFVQYEADDLVATSIYVLTVRPLESGKKSYKAFIWLGREIEKVINRKAAIEICEDYICNKLCKDCVPEMVTEDQCKESKAFLKFFEDGL